MTGNVHREWTHDQSVNTKNFRKQSVLWRLAMVPTFWRTLWWNGKLSNADQCGTQRSDKQYHRKSLVRKLIMKSTFIPTWSVWSLSVRCCTLEKSQTVGTIDCTILLHREQLYAVKHVNQIANWYLQQEVRHNRYITSWNGQWWWNDQRISVGGKGANDFDSNTLWECGHYAM